MNRIANIALGLAALIAFIAVAVGKPTAVSAHHVTLSGVATCQAQSWTITWMATNSESNKTMTIVSPAGFAPTPVPFSGTATRVQTGISFATPSVTSTISATWIGAADTDTATVGRPALCPAATATPTRTSTATATATRTVTPTATLPTSTPTTAATQTPTVSVPTPTVTSTSTPTQAGPSPTPITPTSTPPPNSLSACEGASWVTRINGIIVSAVPAPQCTPTQTQMCNYQTGLLETYVNGALVAVQSAAQCRVSVPPPVSPPAPVAPPQPSVAPLVQPQTSSVRLDPGPVAPPKAGDAGLKAPRHNDSAPLEVWVLIVAGTLLLVVSLFVGALIVSFVVSLCRAAAKPEPKR